DQTTARLPRVLEDVELHELLIRRPGDEIDDHLASRGVLDHRALRGGILLLEGAYEVGGDRAGIVELRVLADGRELRPGLELLAERDVLSRGLARDAALPGEHEDLSVEGQALGRSLAVRVNDPRQA